MDFRDVDVAFPENFRDPVDVEAASVGFENLSLLFSQGVHVRLFAVTAAFRAARDLQEIFGSGFEIVRFRVSQCKIRALRPHAGTFPSAISPPRIRKSRV